MPAACWRTPLQPSRSILPAPRAACRVGRRARLFLEPLEDRWAPATFSVITIGDTGAGVGLTGDLRYCINQANALPGPDQIRFAIPGAGPHTIISTTGGLPVITDTVQLDGWSQGGPGYTGPPLIEID